MLWVSILYKSYSAQLELELLFDWIYKQIVVHPRSVSLELWRL